MIDSLDRERQLRVCAEQLASAHEFYLEQLYLRLRADRQSEKQQREESVQGADAARDEVTSALFEGL